MKKVLYVILIPILFSCSKDDFDMNEFVKMYGGQNEDVGTMITKLSEHHVYFGHQSVGNNILSGVSLWEEETGSSLNLVETRDFASIEENSFIHYRIGINGDPKGKIDDFVSLTAELPDTVSTVSFFKFCYADIIESTDVDDLFKYYKENIINLKTEYPNCQIILFTVPVTRVEHGLKATAKKLLGRSTHSKLDNVKRHEFNNMVRSELSGLFPVFDLEAVETTFPDGSKSTYKYDGNEYPCLPESYSKDIGHLNDYGSKLVAYNLLAFLASETQ
jgi:hypothetical protein